MGVVEVPDSRLQKLADISGSETILPAVLEFVDIAGLVKGASQGEGLGNKLLANIRECDAIVQVRGWVRCAYSMNGEGLVCAWWWACWFLFLLTCSNTIIRTRACLPPPTLVPR